MAVFYTGQGLEAIGEWVSVLSGSETTKFTYNMGFKSTETSKDTTSAKMSLTTQIDEGVKFGVESSSVSISSGYEVSIAHEATESMTRDISISVET